MRHIAIALFILVAAACTSAGEKPESSPPAAADAFELPRYHYSGDCPHQDAPTTCEWAASTDGIVVGNVVGVEVIRSPSVPAVSGREGELLEQCEGVINPAFAIDVEVIEVLSGPSLEAGSQIRVHAGFEQVQAWQPIPYFRDGEIVWEGAGDGVIVAGMTLALAMHHQADFDVWSLMGEPIFMVDDDHLVRQDYHSDCEPAPGLGAISLEEFGTQLRGCQPTEASDARRLRVQNMWGQRPQDFMAAVCIVAEPERTGCLDDSECGSGELCTQGSCEVAQ